MAASIIIEEESGTDTHRVHPHNGYYAGDFSTPRTARRTAAGFLTARSPSALPPRVRQRMAPLNRTTHFERAHCAGPRLDRHGSKLEGQYSHE